MRKLIFYIFGGVVFFTVVLFILFNFILYPTKNENYVIAYSSEYNLDKALVFAIIKTESNFDKNAKSSSGAMGLMQIIPSTAKWIACELGEEYVESNLYNPETNIKYGCFYLNYLFSKFNDRNAVICAYNAGEGVVLKWLGEDRNLDISKIDYNETSSYLKRVSGYYNFYNLHELCF